MQKNIPPFAALVETAVPPSGKSIGNAKSRAGCLDSAALRREIRSRMRPRGLLAYSNKGRASGGVIPGVLGHIAVYLGTEAELRRVGVWNDPRIQPHQTAICAGANFTSADQKGVYLSFAANALVTDRVVVMRPQDADPARRAEAVGGCAQRVGGWFDFHFDNAKPIKIYRSERIAQVMRERDMPKLDMPERRMCGRMTTLPDDIVAHSAVRRSKPDLVAYVRRTPVGWEVAGRQDLIF